MPEIGVVDPPDVFSTKVRQFLENTESDNLLRYFREHGDSRNLDETSWTLVPEISSRLTSENLGSDLFQACDTLLRILAGKCNAGETVLLFLEQIESLEDDVRFKAFLGPLGEALDRSDLDKCIDWVVSTIRSYCEDLPVPDNINPELSKAESEEEPEEPDPVADRLKSLHTSLIIFLEGVVESFDRRRGGRNDEKTKINLVNLLLNMFSRPFSHMELGATVEPLVSMVVRLEQPGTFLRIVEDRLNKRVNKLRMPDDHQEPEAYNLETQFLDIEVATPTYATFFSALLLSDSPLTRFPQVYHPHYLLPICLYLGNVLLAKPEYILVTRGLTLVEETLRRVDEESLSAETLELQVYGDFFKSLSQVMVFCDSRQERGTALRVFQGLFRRFRLGGRLRVIRMLLEGSKHSGFRGLVINLLKEWVLTALGRSERVRGRLQGILGRVLRLERGSKEDLLEVADELIAGLNLLRFLVIRDRKGETGVWEIVEGVKGGFLRELEEGVELSRAHWRAKLNELEEGREEQELGQVQVEVGGNVLQDVQKGDKIKCCHQAIHALDVIESIRIRVNECIEENPMNNGGKN